MALGSLRLVSVLVIVGALLSGCANLNTRASLQPSAVLQPVRGYLYGRFSLDPRSETLPRLFIQLTNLGTSEHFTIHLQRTAQEMYLIDVEPGQYQFTQILFVPVGAMDGDVRRNNLVLPGEINFLGRPFQVEAGKAHYVGDWVAMLSRKTDFYVVVSKITQRWGFSRLAYDYDTATAELRRTYPALGPIETRPAWR